jgi:hypothetical protein
MHHAEVMDHSLDSMHKKNKRRFRANIPEGAIEYKDPGLRPWDVFLFLSQFTQRELSHSADMINAFQGIFQVFERSAQHPVYHFMGVPIPPPWEVRITRPKSIGRTPEGSFVIGLSWMLHWSKSDRRPQFPSWSWAGWKSALANSGWPIYDKLSDLKINDVSVWIEEKDKSLTKFPEWDLMPGFIAEKMRLKYRFIHIQANTVALTMVELDKSFLISGDVKKDKYASIESNIPDYGDYAKIHIAGDTFVYILMIKNSWDNVEKKRLSVILIGEESQDGIPKFGLVVAETKKTAERIGYLKEYVFFISQGNQWTQANDTTISEWFKKLPKERRTIRLG